MHGATGEGLATRARRATLTPRGGTTRSAPGVSLDALGCLLSAACAVHCVVSPVLLAALPLLAWEDVELMLATALGGFSATVIAAGALSHRDGSALLPLVLGLTLISAARAAELEPATETAASLAGSALLALAHLRNRRVCTHAACLAASVPRRRRWLRRRPPGTVPPALLLVLVASCAACTHVASTPPPSGVRSVAVLPVDNRTGSELYADAPPLVGLLGGVSPPRVTVPDLIADELARQLAARGFTVVATPRASDATHGPPSPDQAAAWLRAHDVDAPGLYARLERWSPNESSHLVYVDVALELWLLDPASGSPLWQATLPATPISGGGASTVSLGYPEVARQVVTRLLDRLGPPPPPP
jgi:hypothetical protein